jgi:hypothetical protein
MRIAGLIAANGGRGAQRGRRGRSIALPKRGGSITATSSARTGRGSPLTSRGATLLGEVGIGTA